MYIPAAFYYNFLIGALEQTVPRLSRRTAFLYDTVSFLTVFLIELPVRLYKGSCSETREYVNHDLFYLKNTPHSSLPIFLFITVI